MSASEPLSLSARGLVKHFPVRRQGSRRQVVHAVDGIDVDVEASSTHALVGESGSGKSTVARILLLLERPDQGRVHVGGVDLLAPGRKQLRLGRRGVQMVFQDPFTSLDPRMTIGATVTEPLLVHRIGDPSERRTRVNDLLHRVGLDSDRRLQYPHELSGGERQRVAIARALALGPRVVVCDEAVSNLDVSVQAQVLELLRELQADLGVAYLFISHDLAVVHEVAHTVSVMHLGKIVEHGTRDEVFGLASHPYTAALLSAAYHGRDRGRQRIILRGEPPSPTAPPSGCRFRTRCWKAEALCAIEEPSLIDRGTGHPVACHFPES